MKSQTPVYDALLTERLEEADKEPNSARWEELYRMDAHTEPKPATPLESLAVKLRMSDVR